MLNILVIFDPCGEAHVAILVLQVDQDLELGVVDCVLSSVMIVDPRAGVYLAILVILVEQVLYLGVVDCVLNNIVTFSLGFGIIENPGFDEFDFYQGLNSISACYIGNKNQVHPFKANVSQENQVLCHFLRQFSIFLL